MSSKVVVVRGPRGPQGPQGPPGEATPGGSVGDIQIHGVDDTFEGMAILDVAHGGTNKGTSALVGQAGKALVVNGLENGYTFASASGATPGGSVGQIQINDDPDFGAISHGLVGTVLRQTGATTASFGALDLSNVDATTNTLPASKGGTGVSSLGTGVATFLQTPTSANLRAALTDETGTGAAVFGTSPTITSPTITGSTGASSAVGALNIDWSAANVFTKALSTGSNTLTFSNAADGQVIVVVLTGSSSTVTWPTVKWASGAAPTQTASGTDVYTFIKAGSTIYGSVVQAMA